MSEKAPGTRGIAICFVYASDRARARQFYSEVLECPLLGSDEHGDLFDLGGAHLRLTAMPDFAPTGHPVLGFQVDAIEERIGSLIERGVVFQRLSPGAAVETVWSAPDGRTRLAFFHDTEGNALTLSAQSS